MANQKISELSTAANLQSTDLLVVVNGGETRKTTIADLNQALIDSTSGAEGSCHAASTANINLATGGLLTVDGIAMQEGYRVLVWKQDVASENGIYIASAGAWARAVDFSTSVNVTTGSIIAVTLGTIYGKSIFQVTTVGTITVGTTPLVIERITGWNFDENNNIVSLSDKSVTVGGRGQGQAGTNSFGQGTGIIASGNYSFASGSGTQSTATNSHAQGSFTNATATNSHAQGSETTASGINAHAQGNLTTASGLNAHAQGVNTIASGQHAHAQGQQTAASGTNASASGKWAIASGSESWAGGQGTDSRKIISSGIASFNHSFNTASQREGSGARGDHSAILGGSNNDVAAGADDAAVLGGMDNQVLATALRSVILGGQGISASQADTAYAKIMQLLNHLTINNNTLISPAKNNTVENDGTALYYSNNSALRHHIATVENLRVVIPVAIEDTPQSDSGVGITITNRISIADAADYFPLAASLEATLVCDCRMDDTGATGEIFLRNITSGTGTNITGSLISVPGNTTFNVRKSAVFALTPNNTYAIFMRRATGGGNDDAEIRSAQLILRPKF